MLYWFFHYLFFCFQWFVLFFFHFNFPIRLQLSLYFCCCSRIFSKFLLCLLFVFLLLFSFIVMIFPLCCYCFPYIFTAFFDFCWSLLFDGFSYYFHDCSLFVLSRLWHNAHPQTDVVPEACWHHFRCAMHPDPMMPKALEKTISEGLFRLFAKQHPRSSARLNIRQWEYRGDLI